MPTERYVVLPQEELFLSTTNFPNGCNWFLQNAAGLTVERIASEMARSDITTVDLRTIRQVLISMLLEASNRELFLKENTYGGVIPNEDDRRLTFDWLAFQSTNYGFVTSSEIGMIDNQSYYNSSSEVVDSPQLGDREFKKLITDWKRENLVIGEIDMSADPPTPTHLQLITRALMWLQERSTDSRLIVGLDDDHLLRHRKGMSRPILPLERRRKILDHFNWLLDATFPLSSPDKGLNDDSVWGEGYRQRGVRYVFLTEQSEDLSARMRKIISGGALPVILNAYGELHSSDLARMKNS